MVFSALIERVISFAIFVAFNISAVVALVFSVEIAKSTSLIAFTNDTWLVVVKLLNAPSTVLARFVSVTIDVKISLTASTNVFLFSFCKSTKSPSTETARVISLFKLFVNVVLAFVERIISAFKSVCKFVSIALARVFSVFIAVVNVFSAVIALVTSLSIDDDIFVAKFGSFPNAVANLFNVSNVSGELSTKSAIAVLTSDFV